MTLFNTHLKKVPGEVDRFSVEFSFSIQGKSRPKFDGRTGRAYMPVSYVVNKEDIEWVLREALMYNGKHDFLSSRHLYMERVIAYRKLRKPTSKADAKRLKEQRPIYGHARGSTGAADTDNLIGTLMDSCQGVVYPNDSAVVLSLVERVWTEHWGAFYEAVKVKDPEYD